MIPNQWYAILESKEVPHGRPVGVTRMGENLVAWRDSKGQPHVQSDKCPHRGAALSIGKVVDGHIQCPFHGFEYEGGGQCAYIPANGRTGVVPQAMQVRSYETREEHGYIYIWWGEPQASYPPLPWFDDLDETFFTSDYADPWPVHYSRAIENQLDVFHLPFPHRTTIGRGNRLVADGPLARMDGDEMHIWVYNRVEDGIPARRASELGEPNRPPFLRFRFPNLWMNRISDDMRITAFFTPVDEDHCILYLRYYQRFMRTPGLAQLIAGMINLFSIVIVNQDKRVVVTQRPLKSDLKIGEVLIPADRPIILYRTIRRQLQESATKPITDTPVPQPN